MNTQPTEQQWNDLEREWRQYLDLLKTTIDDDYRCSDDPEDDTPGMCVTFGVTFKDGGFSWSYQTGDNSFTGGAYGHATWAVVYLYRDSNTAELAAEAIGEAAELLPDCED